MLCPHSPSVIFALTAVTAVKTFMNLQVWTGCVLDNFHTLSLSQGFSDFSMHHNSLADFYFHLFIFRGRLLKHRILSPTPDSDSIGLGQCLRIYISNKPPAIWILPVHDQNTLTSTVFVVGKIILPVCKGREVK